ncbi:Zn-ribbon domain-containing OB-fold protein [Amycolatopsis thermoflava]|uniref:Zn-ribbon domain-containing OB-fold protein n=1 Tax=Amycolatopsis thermoflava TaxID=84480 RepID=UPI0038145151
MTTADWLVDDSLAPSTTDEQLGELYRGSARGELVLPFCPACDLALELEQVVCDRCGAAGPVWRQAAPHGRVHSVTVVHRLEPGLVRTRDPYPVADIELACGHRVVLAPLEPGAAPPAIGDTVSIGFRRIGDTAVPSFRSEVFPPTKESR